MRFYGSLERSIINRPVAVSNGREYVVVNGNGWYGNSGCGAYVIRDGEPRLIGIMVLLAWADARAPILCENQMAISEMLGRYLKSKKAVDK